MPSGGIAQINDGLSPLQTPRPVADSLADFLDRVFELKSAPRSSPTANWSPGEDLLVCHPMALRPLVIPGPLHVLKKPDSVRGALARIETWLIESAPKLAGAFAGPASAQAFAGVTKRVGREFPAAVREYFGLHDGQRREMFRHYRFLSIAEAQTERIPADGPWWPIVIHGGSSNHDAISLSAESFGQIVYVEKGEVQEIVTPDLQTYLTLFARSLERGFATMGKNGLLELPDDFKERARASKRSKAK